MSTRYQDLDSDEYRLPDGMRRIGYDADTQIYTFRDEQDGSLWESEPGSRYGRLHRAGTTLSIQEGYDDDAAIKRARREDWRYMAPFFLLVLLFLLVVWRFFGPSLSLSSGPKCPPGSEVYNVVSGDTCWGIAERAGTNVKGLEKLNGGLDCDKLRAGRGLCVPNGGLE